jgi:hypothetical protein
MPKDLYDEMSELDDMGDEAAAEGDMGEAEDIDAEFAMHASEAGFDTPEKQKALKAAIERCNALKDEGEYEEPADDADAGDDEDPLEAFA